MWITPTYLKQLLSQLRVDVHLYTLVLIRAVMSPALLSYVLARTQM